MPVKAALGPRLAVSRVVSPFDWRNHNLLSPAGATFFAPLVGAVKSAVLVTDVNGNGSVNPGDTLGYSVVINNTGADAALNVVFTDTLSTNLTLVPGSVKASPIATNDLYGSIGNVGLNVPAAGGLLANDVDPNGDPLAVVAPIPTVSTQGGALSISSNGAFTYNPPAGFNGVDTFTYTVSDGTQTNTGFVTINVSGVIWFVNNTPGACTANCNGRLSNPFVNVSNLNAVNDGGAGHPKDNEHIFVYTGSGNYDGPLTLRAGQRLIGQGATANLAVITGLSAPAFSNPLPATGGTRPTSSHTATHVTLNTNNLIRGINLQSTAGTALVGTSFNNLAVSETTVSATNSSGGCNAAVSLNQSSGTAAINANFISIAANTCTNGILVQNTTGSFTVQGDGTNNGSGGTIQSTTSHGVSLTNVENISLTSMLIQNISSGSGVKGTQVNGFTFNRGTLSNVGSGAAGSKDCAIAFNTQATFTENNVSGNVTLTNSTITNPGTQGLGIETWSGTISNLIVQNNIFSAAVTTAGGDAIHVFAQGSATTQSNITTGTISGNSITNWFNGSGIIVNGGNTGNATSVTLGAAVTPISIANNSFSNSTPSGTGNAIAVAFNGQNGVGNFSITNNGTLATPLKNFGGVGVSAFFGGNGTFGVTVDNNFLDSNNIAGSAGIAVQADQGIAATDAPNVTAIITNNNVKNNSGIGIRVFPRNSNCVMNVKVANNTVAAPLTAGLFGIRLDGGSGAGNITACYNVFGNTSAGNATTGIGIRKQGTVQTVNNVALQGISQTNPTNTDVVNFLNAQNPAGGGATVIAGSNFSQCASAPTIAPPIDTESEPKQQASNLTTPAPSGATAPLLVRLQQALRPVFAAFHNSLSYVSLEQAFGQAAKAIVPTATATELTASAASRTAHLPAKTLLINSKGEYSVVPTAAIPAIFAGETITINGTGSGFTLPAGESTTVMFNAQVANPLPAGVCSVSNQATVMGSNFATLTSNNVTTNIEAPPKLTGVAPLTRQQGTAVSNSQIATVDDCNQTANTLGVTVNGGATATVNGVTVSNIAVAVNGNVTADVAAACTATNATFTLTVTDNTSQTATTNLTVNVTPNTPPTLGTYPNTGPINIGAGATVTPSAAPTDNGTVVTLTAAAPGFAGTFSGNPTTGVITITNASPGGTYTVTVTATDNCGATTTTTFQLIVNSPPTITGATISRQQGSAATNSPIATVNDADQAANTLVVTVNGGASATVNGVTVSNIQVAANGSVTADVVAACTATNAAFTLTVTDNAGASANATLTVNVTPNTPPTLGNYPNASVAPGAATTVTPDAAPTDNGTVASLTASAPGFTGAFSGNTTTGVITITNANPPGTYTVTVTATDNCGATTNTSFTLTVTCPTITINPASLPVGQINTAYSVTFTASGGTGPYSFTLSGTLPTGMSFASPTLSGTPTQGGNFPITVSVTDANNCTASQSYTLIINRPPVAKCKNVTVAAGTGNTAAASIDDGSFDPDSGNTLTLTQTPPSPYPLGTTTVTLTVTDNHGASSQCTGTVTVVRALLQDYVVFSQEFTQMRSNAKALTGNVGANTSLPDPNGPPDDKEEVVFGPNAKMMQAGSFVTGDTVHLSANSQVYNIAYNELSATNANILGSQLTPLTLPQLTLPPLPTITPGTLDVTVPVNQTQTLAAGSYRNLTVSNNATLVLSGGLYQFNNLDMRSNAKLHCTAATELRVKDEMDADANSFIGPAPAAPGLMASQIIIYVEGPDDGGGLGQLSVDIGTGSTLFVNIYAPNGTVSLRANTVATGAFIGKQVEINENVQVTLKSAFGSLGGGSVAIPSDFDGDGKADPAFFRSTQANWLLQLSGSNTLETPAWGAPGDHIAPGDYDGDGKIDLAVFCPSDGHWRIKRSSDGVTIERAWGLATDVPAPGDYDGDGKTDLALWRSQEATWHIFNSSDGTLNTIPWSSGELPYYDVPVPGDYDGDGKTDLAVFHQQNGVWYIRRSSDGAVITQQWGTLNDIPVPGDYDGDGQTDLAVWRGEQGVWYIRRSSDNQPQMLIFGAANDVPVPGDYDGDGKLDVAVWRPALGQWYSRNSSDGVTRTLQLGEQGDVPVTAARSR